MVFQAMGVIWNDNGFRLWCLAVVILVLLDIQGCWSLNSDGLALLGFRARVRNDPYGAFGNWNSNDDKACEWSGVHCFDDEVQMLDLNGLSLEGELAGQLGKLTRLKSLVLCNNHFSGVIPKEIGELTNLEVLDLRNNSLSGSVPAEIGGLQSLKSLLLSNNDFEGSLPLEFGKLNLLSELQFDENLAFPLTDDGIGCINRKFGHCIWQSSLKQLKKGDSFLTPVKGTPAHYLSALPPVKSGKDSSDDPTDNCCENPPDANETHVLQENLVNMARRGLLQQQPSNLAAAPAGDVSPTEQIISVPAFKSSGSFPAVPIGKKGQAQEHVPPPADPSSHQSHNALSPENPSTESDQTPSSGGTSWSKWKYVVVILGSILLLLIIAGAMFFICRKKTVPTIGPWKTGLSGQLRKALITGVPKLNRAELEAACEDFSNIIGTFDGCTVYKGTLSSGVEISVVSVVTCPAKDWSKQAELAYRKKIDKMSRVNHKNFVNLIGYCEEDEPFTRIMVFEYAPSGTLSEHLHVKDMEHLDWSARMRIIMGAAYCLQHMHELNPPVAIDDLNADCIYLTDDYAAKVADCRNGIRGSSKSALSGKGKPEPLLPPDREANVYRFGVLLLEIISAKLPSEEHGHLVNWAADYLKEKESMKQIVDPTLKSFKEEELEIICQVIQDCILPDSKKRPTMKEVTLRLKEVLAITPEQATPRLSPLWWAELEILSEGA